MKALLYELWRWLTDATNNRGVVVLVAIASLGVALVALLKSKSPVLPVRTQPTHGGEVRLSLEDFRTELESRAQEEKEHVTQVHFEERTRLENQLREINRQLSSIETAYADRQAEIRELEDELSGLIEETNVVPLAEIRTAMELGNYSKADALLAEAETQENSAILKVAGLAFQRGKIAALQIRWDQAAAHFERAARLDPTYRHLMAAGKYAERSARYRAAIHHFEELLKITRAEYGAWSSETATVLNELGGVLRSIGQYEEAERTYLRALEISRETDGEKHPNYASKLNNLADLLREAGRYDEAKPLFLRSLAISQETIGDKHPDYASRLNNYAGLLQATGQYAQAEPLYRQALHIGWASLGEKHPENATRLNNLAYLLAATGRYSEAEPLYRQALELGAETLGVSHPEYAVYLNNLGSLCRATGRYTEAESLFRQALNVSLQVLGDGHPDYGTRLNNLAGLFAATGRHFEAEPLMRQALDILRKAMGDANPSTRKVARNYARLLRAWFPDDPVLAELKAVFGDDIGRN